VSSMSVIHHAQLCSTNRLPFSRGKIRTASNDVQIYGILCSLPEMTHLLSREWSGFTVRY